MRLLRQASSDVPVRGSSQRIRSRGPKCLLRMPRRVFGTHRPGTGCACTSPPVRVNPLALFRKEDVMAQHLRDEPELVQDVMTRNPITLSETATVQEAALAMREA